MTYLHDDQHDHLKKKIPFAVFFIFLFFCVVVGRLYYLQIARGEHYQRVATEVFVRAEEVVARRGQIADRDGKVLATTRDYLEIVITPQYVSDLEKVIHSVTGILPVEREHIRSALQRARFEPSFLPVAIVEDAPYDWVARLMEYLPVYQKDSKYDFSGVAVRHFPVRYYPHPQIFSHALGYLTEIDRERLKKLRNQSPDVYGLGDLVGAAGVEKTYDVFLKGRDGTLGRVVDARGKEVEAVSDLKVLQAGASEKPEEGLNLRTTLHFESQVVAHELFEGKKGAVVALDPQNGEILVLYSAPAYDPNRIVKKVDRPYWQKINLDPDKYLFNRAVQAMYPPASTYKMVVLTAGIDSGVIDPEKTRFYCPGGIQWGNRYFKCWRRGGHGSVNVIKGLAQSCDVFFYRVGLAVGVDRLAEYAGWFGMGQQTGIDVPFEQKGLVPTSRWKENTYGQSWQESETLSVAIGQSYDLVTTLQNAVAVALIANGGYRVTPHLAKAVVDGNQKIVKVFDYPTELTPLAGSEAIEWVKKGMIEVVHGWGTATRLRNSPVKIAGKTGTAQVVGEDFTRLTGGKKPDPHALFVAFAPIDDPKIAVAVVVENGKSGSATAAPIAQKIIEVYLQ